MEALSAGGVVSDDSGGATDPRIVMSKAEIRPRSS